MLLLLFFSVASTAACLRARVWLQDGARRAGLNQEGPDVRLSMEQLFVICI